MAFLIEIMQTGGELSLQTVAGQTAAPSINPRPHIHPTTPPNPHPTLPNSLIQLHRVLPAQKIAIQVLLAAFKCCTVD